MSATVVEGTVINDRYRLDRVIGHGGMADVYGGRDELLDRPVAVKIPLPAFRGDERFVRRFAKEARAAAALNHPNVVSVFDRGDVDDVPYIVMELVEGSTLRQLIDAQGFTEEESLRIARDVCRALEYAHSRGFVHRDMKPDNVLITSDGVTKVTDFGIVRAIGDRTITSTRPLGSVAYVSPEQATGREVDARSDLYSLGIVLYEMLTGTRPFEADSPIAVALAHIDTAPPPIADLVPTVSPAAQRIVECALAKDPDDRYGSAAEMREALDLALATLATAAVPVSPAPPRDATRVLGDGVDPDAPTLLGLPVDPAAPTVPPAPPTTQVVADGRRTVALDAAPTGYAAGVGGDALLTAGTDGRHDPAAPSRRPAPATTAAPAHHPDLQPEVAATDLVWNWNRQRLTLVLLGTIAVLLVFGLYPTRTSVTVPDVVGLDDDPARQVLADHDLGIVVAGFDATSDLPDGAVVRMDPAPGTELLRGLTVEVIISRPPR